LQGEDGLGEFALLSIEESNRKLVPGMKTVVSQLAAVWKKKSE
jgi:hypothetical protein